MEINQEIAEKIFKNIKVSPTKVEFLAAGNNNKNYRIYSNEGAFVLRIELGSQFNNLEKEYEFLKKFKGLGPKVFYLDTSKKVIPSAFLIEEFIEGEPIDKIETAFLNTAGKWYKRLHSNKNNNYSKYSTEEFFFDLEVFFENTASNRYDEFRYVLDKKWEMELTPDFKKASEIIKNNKKLFNELNKLSLTHGDPSKGNIFYSKGTMRVIDWEFSEYSIPESELVFFIWTHGLSKKQETIFLKSYGCNFSEESKKRLDVVYLIHLLSMISWRVQRLDLINKGKIEKGSYLSTQEDIYKETEKDLLRVNELIESFS